MCAKNHLLIFSSFLDIWENVEWPRFFGPPCKHFAFLYPVYTMKLARRAGSTSARRAGLMSWLLTGHFNGVILQTFTKLLVERSSCARRALDELARRATSSSSQLHRVNGVLQVSLTLCTRVRVIYIVSHKTGTTIYILTTALLFAFMAYSFCHIKADVRRSMKLANFCGVISFRKTIGR